MTHLLHVFLRHSNLMQHSPIFLLTLFLVPKISEKAFVYDVHQGLLYALWMGELVGGDSSDSFSLFLT